MPLNLCWEDVNQGRAPRIHIRGRPSIHSNPKERLDRVLFDHPVAREVAVAQGSRLDEPSILFPPCACVLSQHIADNVGPISDVIVAHRNHGKLVVGDKDVARFATQPHPVGPLHFVNNSLL